MFTGIVEEVGRVSAVEDLGGGKRLTLEAGLSGGLRPDQSVAVNGACQTVVTASDHTFEVVAIEETLRKTNFGALAPGAPVNLERAMAPTGRLDGHFVQGHVDATGTVTRIVEEATSRLYTVAFDAAFAPYLIPVGSVTVDGVSLTVARLEDETFTVAVIPHTYTHTIVAGYDVGTRVNLEFDMIGKYVVRWLSLRRTGPAMPAPAGG